MLREFLEMNRSEILRLTEEKTRRLAGLLSASERLKEGLPLLLRTAYNGTSNKTD